MMNHINKEGIDMKLELPEIIDKANTLLKDTCMNFYDETRPLYLETDASGLG